MIQKQHKNPQNKEHNTFNVIIATNLYFHAYIFLIRGNNKYV